MCRLPSLIAIRFHILTPAQLWAAISRVEVLENSRQVHAQVSPVGLCTQVAVGEPVLHHLADQAPHFDSIPATGEHMPPEASDCCGQHRLLCFSIHDSVLCGTANFLDSQRKVFSLFHRSLKSLGSQQMGFRRI